MAEEQIRQGPEAQTTRSITPSENFSEDYANLFSFEPSVWDFKIIFGQADKTAEHAVNWHTAITMPWGVAKLLSAYLRMNLLAWEISNGVIGIPRSAMPEAPPEPTGEDDTPKNRAFWEASMKLHQRLLSRVVEPEPPSEPPVESE